MRPALTTGRNFRLMKVFCAKFGGNLIIVTQVGLGTVGSEDAFVSISTWWPFSVSPMRDTESSAQTGR